jgi:hypothetical protein
MFFSPYPFGIVGCSLWILIWCIDFGNPEGSWRFNPPHGAAFRGSPGSPVAPGSRQPLQQLPPVWSDFVGGGSPDRGRHDGYPPVKHGTGKSHETLVKWENSLVFIGITGIHFPSITAMKLWSNLWKMLVDFPLHPLPYSHCQLTQRAPWPGLLP